MRRQHALREGMIPSEAQRINGELGGGESRDPTSSAPPSREPGRFRQEPSAHQPGEGRERKSASATLHVKGFFPDDEETQQLQS